MTLLAKNVNSNNPQLMQLSISRYQHRTSDDTTRQVVKIPPIGNNGFAK
jgi:hypothetical protein